MKIDKSIHHGASNLLLCFAGWSASPALFEPLLPPSDTDVWIVYDYRDLSFDADLNAYRTIRLVAWSLGVWVAEQTLTWQSLPLRTAVAINGTSLPIDNRYGIPETIFRGTLDHLNPAGMHRFVRRMCGNPEVRTLYETYPSRPLEEVADELVALYAAMRPETSSTVEPSEPNRSMIRPTSIHSSDRSKSAPISGPFPIGWTKAILSTQDRIFPPENLRAYWHDRCPTEEIEAPHYPFYRWKKWEELWK